MSGLLSLRTPLRSSRKLHLVPQPRRSFQISPILNYSTQLARKSSTSPPPRFRYSGFTPTQSFALSFLTIFFSSAVGYALSSLLEAEGIHLFSPTPPPSVSSLDLDPLDESIIGSGTYRPIHGSKKGYQAAISALQSVFDGLGRGDAVSTDEEDLRLHGVSEWSYHEAEPASVVVWAERCDFFALVICVSGLSARRQEGIGSLNFVIFLLVRSIEDVKRVVDIARKVSSSSSSVPRTTMTKARADPDVPEQTSRPAYSLT